MRWTGRSVRRGHEGHLRASEWDFRTVGPYDLQTGRRPGGARRCPPFAVTWRPNHAASWGATSPGTPATPEDPPRTTCLPRSTPPSP
ncbi:hypothetical protein F750_2871 [Streptomyces sp. PAMC 26508]|nr:hypothetical protein F750_2871 [Streptomyces sp. PAMC 26508]